MSAAPPAGWTLQDKALTKTFRFKTFADAIAFMVKVSLHCERTDHHPEWTNVYNRVDVRLTTHDAGDVTGKDHALARVMDGAAAGA